MTKINSAQNQTILSTVLVQKDLIKKQITKRKMPKQLTLK